ncbi:sugar diacid utilization regulator [Pseudonocardia hierapolitana]|uniref:Sugar diacid utilization regulator n=1 Tax=Pseudonocardia hierapolitana TaxID=1128676 RepID=A0A561SLK8_9PSEU|nr:helix-turn-helix domain-containing protein [Pseudonocardia hierapolitana]TWF75750.1 sugar diacid utilization regulator [Pseudonocardia hierapolitana]
MPSRLNGQSVAVGAAHRSAPVENFLRRLVCADTVAAATQAAVDVVREALPADVSWCGITSGDYLTMAAHSGMRTAEMPALWRLRVGQGIGGRVAKEGRTITTRDYRRDPRRVPVMKRIIDAEGIRGGICAPLTDGIEVLGVLYADQRTPRDWTAPEMHFVTGIAHDTGTALGRIRERQRERQRAEEAEQRARDKSRTLDVVRAAATSLARSGDISAGVDMLAQHLGYDVELLDPAREPLGETPSDAGAAPVRLLVDVGDEPLGALCVRADHEPTSSDAELVDVCARLIALQLLRERAALQSELRVHGELLDDLLEGRTDDRNGLLSRAALLGVDLKVPRYVVCIGLRAPSGELDREDAARAVSRRPFSQVEQGIRRYAPESIVVPRGGDIVVLLAAGTTDPGQIQRALEAVLSAAHTAEGLAAGLGRMCIRVADYAESYAQAALALSLARTRGRREVVLSAADLGLYGLLVGGSTRQSLESMVESALGPILEADAVGGSEYVKTLDAYLASDRHLERAAACLHVHPNTVRYRLAKVQETLGVNLRDVDDRFLLELALRVQAALDGQ